MKRINIMVAALMAAGVSIAQTSYEAADMLGTDLIGSARFVGMGGAMSAFGNDLSVISKNPAGIGLYTTNDLMTTMSFSNSKTFVVNPGKSGDISYTGKNTTSPLHVGLDNMAFVMVNPLDNGGSVNVAFAYHKIKDQRYTMVYNDDFQDTEDYTIYRDFENNVSNRMDQYDFNLSANLNGNIYLGATLGVLSSQYRSDGFFYDYYPKQNGISAATDFFSYDGLLDYDAAGWNMSFGLIMRSTSGHSRLGLSVQTPTIMHVNAKYEDYLYAELGNRKNGDLFSQTTTYNVYTPWVFNLSLGFSGDHSALGFEYELLDANRASIHSGHNNLNTQVSEDMMAYSTFRLGYEANVDKMSFRIGYNSSTPLFRTQAYKYLADTQFNADRKDYHFNNLKVARNFTAGIGYCSAPGAMGEQYYIDGAYVYSNKRSDFSVGNYPVSADANGNVTSNMNSPVVEFSNNGHRFVLSVGCCF